MNVKIRNAQRTDAPIIAWTTLTVLDMDYADLDRFIGICSEDDSLYSWKNSRIAEVNGMAVGCIISYKGDDYWDMRVRTWPRFWNNFDPEYLKTVDVEARPDEFYIDSVAVIPEFRGYGIGVALLEDSVRRGRKSDCKNVTLLVEKSKIRLKTFYEKVGFIEFGEMEFFGHDYFRMKYNR